MATQIRLRRDTAANWTASNPVLALGEPGIETNTRKIKYGDGTTAWTALAYSAGDVNFSGDYNDLTNKPSIPDGTYDSLTGKPSLVTAIDDLSDVTITSAATGQVLKYNGTNWVNDTDSTGSSTGNITFSDTTMTSTNGDVKIHFSPSASPAVEFNFTNTGALTLPGGIVLENRQVKNTGELSGEVQITTATTQGDTEKNWTFNHNGTGTLIVPEGSSVQSKSNFNITATETGFIKFTNIVDFDTNSTVDDNQISIVNPEASVLDLIDPASANYVGGLGSVVRIVYGPFRSAVGEIIEAFADPGTLDPLTGLPRYQGRIDIVNPSNGDLLKEFSIEHSSTWKFGSDGNLTLPGEIVKLEVDDANPSGGLVVSVDTGTGTGSKSLYKFGRGGQFTSRSISLTNSSGVPVGTIVGDGLGPIIGAGAGKEVWVSTDGQHLWRFTADRSFVLPAAGGNIRSEGNINIDVNLTDSTLRRWQFGEDGTTTFPDNTLKATNGANAVIPSTPGTAGAPLTISAGAGGIAADSLNAGDGGNLTITAGDAGSDIGNPSWGAVGGTLVLKGGNSTQPYAGSNVEIHSGNSASTPGVISLYTGTNQWTFGADGNLTLPAGGDIKNSSGTSVLGGGATYDQSLNTTDNVTFNQVTPTEIRQNATRTVSATSVTVPGATPTVVYSAPNHLTSIKLVIAAEGQLDGDVTNVRHTQTCEATIAATYKTAAEPIISVYGIVYTSSAPLATFTVTRNTLAGTIEVTAINSQTTNALDVRVHAIQFVSTYD
jgi:hypothetical protein